MTAMSVVLRCGISTHGRFVPRVVSGNLAPTDTARRLCEDAVKTVESTYRAQRRGGFPGPLGFRMPYMGPPRLEIHLEGLVSEGRVHDSCVTRLGIQVRSTFFRNAHDELEYRFVIDSNGRDVAVTVVDADDVDFERRQIVMEHRRRRCLRTCVIFLSRVACGTIAQRDLRRMIAAAIWDTRTHGAWSRPARVAKKPTTAAVKQRSKTSKKGSK